MAAPRVQTNAGASVTTTTATRRSEYIGEKAALKVALKDAGLDAKNCVDIETELDLDDLTPHYDVSVKSGGREYEYDIDAYSGAILKCKVEIDD